MLISPPAAAVHPCELAVPATSHQQNFVSSRWSLCQIKLFQAKAHNTLYSVNLWFLHLLNCCLLVPAYSDVSVAEEVVHIKQCAGRGVP